MGAMGAMYDTIAGDWVVQVPVLHQRQVASILLLVTLNRGRRKHPPAARPTAAIYVGENRCRLSCGKCGRNHNVEVLRCETVSTSKHTDPEVQEGEFFLCTPAQAPSLKAKQSLYPDGATLRDVPALEEDILTEVWLVVRVGRGTLVALRQAPVTSFPRRWPHPAQRGKHLSMPYVYRDVHCWKFVLR